MVRFVKLYVDTQEKSRYIAIERYIKSTKGRWCVNSFEIRKLKTGDYVTEDWFVGFERKGMDLMGSLYSGVLKQQLHELKNAVRHPYLILDFNSTQEIVDNFHVNPDIVIGLLASVRAKYGVQCILGGDYFVPHMIRTIYKHYESLSSKGEYVPLRPIRLVKQKATIKEWKLSRIESLPNVGPGLAKRIYEHFGHSYIKFVNADISEYKKIPGISDGIAKKIKKVLT